MLLQAVIHSAYCRTLFAAYGGLLITLLEAPGLTYLATTVSSRGGMSGKFAMLPCNKP